MYGYPNNNYLYQQYPNFAENMNMVRQQQMQQPINNMTMSNQINNNSALIWVQGENSAKSYLVARGETVVLRDSENPNKIYIKSADMNGVPQMEIFNADVNINENNNSKSNKTFDNNIDYVTREEFESLKKRINSIVEDAKNKGDISDE